ncbi:ABC transporter permease [Pseudomonas nicosulfuronedens]|uniref:Transport permease protein n=1 Tax=Pseudomonas nicosulfuronedens TaxID=2571105 RepID=A0A5R9R106_9PSED|nr:ABC transporter permease [Pseudomonas nicosulfuronedens]MDH1008760.1 ABC transporter permease [Pseudomonas nicosulfuronedens]MDH1981659.1 ABC transporter permease [Pseudomonas nicosulfuronedens]MDH2028579.1 ABC transporter permease [Pseudomonas nicosulfuronedens]TLX76232.1 ABC transporter permease [Pseudomonas nicosulfuronedens]
MIGLLKNIWLYRHFILSSIKNEFLVRFSRSRLGALWMLVHPLTQVLIYALVLSNVLAAKLPGVSNHYAYAIYLLAGMLGWNLFSEIVSRCLTIFTDQGNLIKKMLFPRITLPAIAVGSCLVNNVLLMIAMIAVLFVLGHPPGLEMFWLFPLTLLVIAIAVGAGLTLGILNVFVRDIGQVVPIFLQILFWFTPIVYPVNIIPENLKSLVEYNPLYHIIGAYHQVILYNAPPQLDATAVLLLAFALGLLAFGLFIFRRAAPEIVDSL